MYTYVSVGVSFYDNERLFWHILSGRFCFLSFLPNGRPFSFTLSCISIWLKVIQIYSWIAVEIWVGQCLSVLAWPLAYMFGLKEPIQIDWFLIDSYIKRKIKLYDFQAFNFVVWESLKGILDIFKPKIVIWYLSHSTLFCENC